jgi:sugar phosphate isomerase/epimerase
MAYPETIRGEGPIVETVATIAEDPFFQAIEIGWIKDPSVRPQVKSVLQDFGMKVGHGAQSALLLQGLNLNSFDEVERARAVDQLKSNIDEAKEIGAKRVAFLSGKDPGEGDRERALDLLVDSTLQACEYAAGKGLALTCETFDRDIDKKCLIGPSDYAVAYAERIRDEYPDFGLMYDLSHMPLLYEKANEALPTLRDVLVHIHVGNCVLDPESPGYGDLHPRFGFPGGENDVEELAEFVRVLFEVGYLNKETSERPWVGFEVKPQSESEDSAELIATTKKVWEQAWATI